MNDVKYNQQLDAEINWFFKINYLKKKKQNTLWKAAW